MKTLFKMLSIIYIIIALLPNIVNAETIFVEITTNKGLNVRADATTNSIKIAILEKGTVLKVSSDKKIGPGCSDGWYKIISNNYKDKYICSTYTKKKITTTSKIEQVQNNSNTKNVVVTTKINIRDSATTKSTKAATLNSSTSLTVNNSKKNGQGCTAGWYQIASGTYKGKYICSDYTRKNPVESCNYSISSAKAKSLGVSTSETFVEVDLSEQQVVLYKNGKCLIKSDAVTGQAEDQGGPKNAVNTRIGRYKIKYKEKNHYFASDNVWSEYWMPFDGGIGLHDAKWRSQFGKDRTDGKLGSHGCVNLPLEAAKTIYNNVSKGTIVLVHN